MTLEFWRPAIPVSVHVAGAMAKDAEELGWTGVFFGDSQNIIPDPYVCLTEAAGCTKQILLGTGVTNSVTRHPAVTAAAGLAIQDLSHGRFIIGIGRGDSAVHYIGQRPMRVLEFDDYLRQLQSYLRGETLDTNGMKSRIEWLPTVNAPKPAVSVAATGPKMMAVAAKWAERLTLSVGCDPERVASAIAQARAACEQIGRDPDSLEIGSYAIVAPNDDLTAARNFVRGIVSIHARFGAMHGVPVEGMNERDAAATLKMVQVHTEEGHGFNDAPQGSALDADFVDRFAIVGPVETCVARIRALAELGISHLYIICESRSADIDERERLYMKFATEVIPRIRDVTATPSVPGGTSKLS